MRYALLLALPTLVVATNAYAAARGDRNETTVIRPMDAPFTEIRLDGPLDLTVSEGPQYRVSVTIDENLHEYVETKVEKGVLKVHVTENLKYRGKGSVAVVLPELRSLETRGSGNTEVTTGKTPRELELESSGSGDIVATVVASKLEIETEASGSIRVTGRAETVEANAEGSGDVRYDGNAKTVYVESSGSGDVDLSGNTKSLRVSASGSGDVDARSMKAHDAEIMMTGSGDLGVTMAGGRLLAKLRGSGDLDWWGAAQVEAASTGADQAIDPVHADSVSGVHQTGAGPQQVEPGIGRCSLSPFRLRLCASTDY